MGLWVRAHATVKNMGSMGDSDAEKGGLLSLTYASPPEWDCPPGTCPPSKQFLLTSLSCNDISMFMFMFKRQILKRNICYPSEISLLS